MKIEVTTRNPVLARISSALEGPERRAFHEAMGTEVQEATVRHLAELASSRHATAQRLGASPSGHLAQAAEKVAAPAALSADSGAATLTINHVGMIRAFRDVVIVPREAQSLAIPVHALAYNKRPAQLWEQLGLFIAKGMIMMPRGPGEAPLALYKLVRSVTQKQDRTLLPSNAQWEAAATKGAETFVKSLPS